MSEADESSLPLSFNGFSLPYHLQPKYSAMALWYEGAWKKGRGVRLNGYRWCMVYDEWRLMGGARSSYV